MAKALIANPDRKIVSIQALADKLSLSADDVSKVCRRQKVPVARLAQSGVVDESKFMEALGREPRRAIKLSNERSEAAKAWWDSAAGKKRREAMKKNGKAEKNGSS